MVNCHCSHRISVLCEQQPCCVLSLCIVLGMGLVTEATIWTGETTTWTKLGDPNLLPLTCDQTRHNHKMLNATFPAVQTLDIPSAAFCASVATPPSVSQDLDPGPGCDGPQPTPAVTHDTGSWGRPWIKVQVCHEIIMSDNGLGVHIALTTDACQLGMPTASTHLCNSFHVTISVQINLTRKGR